MSTTDEREREDSNRDKSAVSFCKIPFFAYLEHSLASWLTVGGSGQTFQSVGSASRSPQHTHLPMGCSSVQLV